MRNVNRKNFPNAGVLRKLGSSPELPITITLGLDDATLARLQTEAGRQNLPDAEAVLRAFVASLDRLERVECVLDRVAGAPRPDVSAEALMDRTRSEC